MTFKGKINVIELLNGSLYLLNGACYDKSLYEAHTCIVNHIHVYAILVDLMTLTLDDF